MRAALRRESGATLVELLVVMVIFAAVGGVVLTSTVNALQNAAATNARIDALQELELAMQRVTRDLRAADPLELVAGEYDTALGASILRDGARSSVRFRLIDVGDVQQMVREDTSQTLVTNLDNGGAPVFEYLDRFGEEITCTTDCDTALLQAAQVQVRFVRVIPNTTPAIVETRVGVRNLRHGSDS
jgi:type II secretory pathway pseudopilin PulG